MEAIIKQKKMRCESHSRCFACGEDNADGLHLAFTQCEDNCVIAYFTIGHKYQGYPGIVQGGIVSTLLDCAMTNCLFRQGVEAMTVRLNIKFSEPVMINECASVVAKVTGQRGRVYDLEAYVRQRNRVRASATGRFMEMDDVL